MSSMGASINTYNRMYGNNKAIPMQNNNFTTINNMALRAQTQDMSSGKEQAGKMNITEKIPAAIEKVRNATNMAEKGIAFKEKLDKIPMAKKLMNKIPKASRKLGVKFLKMVPKGATRRALRIGLKVGGKVAAKFIPGVNIISTALDIYDGYKFIKKTFFDKKKVPVENNMPAGANIPTIEDSMPAGASIPRIGDNMPAGASIPRIEDNMPKGANMPTDALSSSIIDNQIGGNSFNNGIPAQQEKNIEQAGENNIVEGIRNINEVHGNAIDLNEKVHEIQKFRDMKSKFLRKARSGKQGNLARKTLSNMKNIGKKGGAIYNVTSVALDLYDGFNFLKSKVQGLFEDSKKSDTVIERNTTEGEKVSSNLHDRFNISTNQSNFRFQRYKYLNEESQDKTSTHINQNLNKQMGINDVNMVEKDTQLLREVTERESLNSFTTLAPSIKIEIENINENADAEKVIQMVTERINQEIEASVRRAVII